MKLINEAAAPAISTAFGGDTNVLTPLTNGLGTLSQDLTNAVSGSDPLAVTAVNGDATLLQTWVTSNCGSSSSDNSNSNSAAPTTSTAPSGSGSGSASSSGWCGTLDSIANGINPSSDNPPSKSTLQQWEATVTNLDNNIPESETLVEPALENLSQDLTKAINGTEDPTDGQITADAAAITAFTSR